MDNLFENGWMIFLGIIIGILLWEGIARHVESSFKISLKKGKKDERTTR